MERQLGFIEVPDGRISRLHCIISLQASEGCEGGGSGSAGSGGTGAAAHMAVALEDCSSNGTFLNGKKLRRGQTGEGLSGERLTPSARPQCRPARAGGAVCSISAPFHHAPTQSQAYKSINQII